MPRKKNQLSPDEQRKRFEQEVKSRSEAGDFDPEKADEALDALVRKSIKEQVAAKPEGA